MSLGGKRPPASGLARERKRQGALGTALWRRVREPLARSVAVKRALASVIVQALKFVERTNPRVPGSHDPAVVSAMPPTIFAFWHGQHLLYPALRAPDTAMAVMFSKSPDAELNALVAQRFGLHVIRGSGGRVREKSIEKGAIKGLIALRNCLSEGKSVAVSADVPHVKSREAGPGIVTLAKISGCPIVPAALATSRRKVVEKSWDKTTINLPFGRSALVFGEPIHVPAELGEEELQAFRRAVTIGLDAVTGKAQRLADGKE